MLKYVLSLVIGLAGFCLAASADLSNGFNSNLSWQSPATLQVMILIGTTKLDHASCMEPEGCSFAYSAMLTPTSCTIYACKNPAHNVYGIEQGVDLSHNTKPIMYLFNQPWCGACKRLKETFQQEGDKISKLSQKFILVNVGGDDNSAFGVRVIPVLQQPPAILACCSPRQYSCSVAARLWVGIDS